MEQILKDISQKLDKDFIDYLSIFASLLISTVAIVLTIWNTIIVKKHKSAEAYLRWDDLSMKFIIIIRNTGFKLLIIDTITLLAYDEKTKKELCLGNLCNVWALNSEQRFIKNDEILIITPDTRSIYDLFAYKGHSFYVDNINKNYKVKILITDIDNKKWEFKTNYTLLEIDEKI